MRVKLLSELKSMFAGRPVHTLTTRSLKNVDLNTCQMHSSPTVTDGYVIQDTQSHTVLLAVFPGKPWSAGCPDI